MVKWLDKGPRWQWGSVFRRLFRNNRTSFKPHSDWPQLALTQPEQPTIYFRPTTEWFPQNTHSLAQNGGIYQNHNLLLLKNKSNRKGECQEQQPFKIVLYSRAFQSVQFYILFAWTAEKLEYWTSWSCICLSCFNKWIIWFKRTLPWPAS